VAKDNPLALCENADCAIILRDMVTSPRYSQPADLQETVAKRDRTRASLIKAAFIVYAHKGFDAPTVDDFIAEAGVSRGTFYNYFQTREELMAAVAADLIADITSWINAATNSVQDPLERLSVAVRYFLLQAAKNETRAWVLIRMIPIVGGSLTLEMGAHARVGIEAAAATGRIHVRSIAASVDLGLGTLIMAIRHNLSHPTSPYSPELVAAMALQSLGAAFEEADEVAYRPLPRLLPARSHPAHGVGAPDSKVVPDSKGVPDSKRPARIFETAKTRRRSATTRVR